MKEYTRFIRFLQLAPDPIHSRVACFYWKQTITASYRREAAIYAVLFSFRKHRNSSCHLERVPGQPDPLTLEHGYENCMANEYEFSTETKSS